LARQGRAERDSRAAIWRADHGRHDGELSWRIGGGKVIRTRRRPTAGQYGAQNFCDGNARSFDSTGRGLGLAGGAEALIRLALTRAGFEERKKLRVAERARVHGLSRAHVGIGGVDAIVLLTMACS
jgi:hypothetical protein